MTPKERARKVWETTDYMGDLIEAYTNAITEAVAENDKKWAILQPETLLAATLAEWERCAFVADVFDGPEAEAIAAAIQSRGEIE